MGYALLGLAIVLEVCGTTCMKLSGGFSRLVPSVLVFVCYGACFGVFMLSLRKLDVSVRTIENHSRRVFEKMGADSVAEVVRLVLSAESADG